MANIISTHRTDTVEIRIRADKVIEIEALDVMKRRFELEDTEIIIEKIAEVQGEADRLLVFIKNGKHSISSRKYLSSRKDIAVKIAMVADKPLQKLVGNFFLGLNKPLIETRLFNRKSSAEEWLTK